LFNLYQRLLACLAQPATHRGEWQLLEAHPAWDDNPTWSDFILYIWNYGDELLLVAVNYSPHPSQCYVRLPYPWLQNYDWSLEDWLTRW
jgi:hypothetical protein